MLSTFKRRKEQEVLEEEEDDGDIVETVERELVKTSELKWHDFAISPSFASVFTHVVDVSAIPQGVGSTSRIGDRIKLKNLSYFFQAYNVATLVAIYSFRLTIFQWYPTSVPTVGDIYEGAGWNAPFNMANRQMYRIHYETKRLLASHVYANANCYVFEGTLKFRGPHSIIQFDAGATSGTNKLYVCFTAGFLSSATTMSYRGMIRYVDYS